MNRIKSPFFLEILYCFIFEMNMERDIKQLYLSILKNMILNSPFNCSFLASKTIIQRLMIYLRGEPDNMIKELISDILK
jgi:hypothetical protein